MPSPMTTISRFVLERLSDEPLGKRAELYRALAATAPTNTERRILNAMASECEAFEQRHAQLVLDFKRGAA